jgi:hypothetical protein
MQLSGAGVSEAQFQLFVSSSTEAMRQLAAECLHLDYLVPDENAEQSPKQPRVH